MSITTDIYSVLAAIPSVPGGVFPEVVPEGELRPHIVYSFISSPANETLSGEQGLENSRYQFDCWAQTKIGADALRESVNAAIRASALDAVFLGRNPSDYDSITKLFKESIDFSFWH